MFAYMSYQKEFQHRQACLTQSSICVEHFNEWNSSASPSCQNAKAIPKSGCFCLFLIFIFKDVLENSFQVCNQSNYQMCKQNIALANRELYKFSSILPHIQQNPCPQRIPQADKKKGGGERDFSHQMTICAKNCEFLTKNNKWLQKCQLTFLPAAFGW